MNKIIFTLSIAIACTSTFGQAGSTIGVLSSVKTVLKKGKSQ